MSAASLDAEPAPASTVTSAPASRAWKRPALVALTVLFLLAIFATELISTVRQESLTWDEGAHIFAGYMTWKTFDYGLNPEHPPLMKLLATVPLLDLPLKIPVVGHRFFKEEAYFGGRSLLYGNAPAFSADDLILRTRLPIAAVALLLGLLVFLCGQEMFGTGAGLMALAILIFEPNVVAHGAFVTTDMGVSCFLLATVYAFYRYTKEPTWGRMALTGVATGLALATKHSAILIVPILILLALTELGLPDRLTPLFTFSDKRKKLARLARAMAVIGALSLFVLWAFYGFRYSARPDGLKLDPSLVDYVRPLKPSEAQSLLLAARFHLLPEAYLYGLADVRGLANTMASYIFGKVYEHGVWFYFPSVLVIKSTLGFLGLLVVSLAAVALRQVRRTRELLFLAIPPVFYFYVASHSGLNIGARHILPVYVFCCVLAAAGAYAWARHNRRIAYAVAALLFVHAASSLHAYPNYIAYSNELWGGPKETYKTLTDTDWAQELKATKTYVDQHHVKQCWIAYLAAPFILPADYGIPCKLLPTYDTLSTDAQYTVPPKIEGPVLISAGDLSGFEFGSNVLNPYRSFQALEPADRIEDGILVYNGSFDVPLASALSHVQESSRLLLNRQYEPALAEAQIAAQVAPEALQTELALGDALAGTGKLDEAKVAYRHAMRIAQTMEPDAQAVWVPLIKTELGER